MSRPLSPPPPPPPPPPRRYMRRGVPPILVLIVYYFLVLSVWVIPGEAGGSGSGSTSKRSDDTSLMTRMDAAAAAAAAAEPHVPNKNSQNDDNNSHHHNNEHDHSENNHSHDAFFQLIDTNHDRSIDAAEFHGAMRKLHAFLRLPYNHNDEATQKEKNLPTKSTGRSNRWDWNILPSWMFFSFSDGGGGASSREERFVKGSSSGLISSTSNEGGGDNNNNKAQADPSSSSSTTTTTTTTTAFRSEFGFASAFTSSVALILATELGDKTFFLAALLSMQHDRRAVLLGALAALYTMTVLSTVLGRMIVPQLLPPQYARILGGILFLYFGVKLLYDSRALQAGKISDELEEVEEELKLHQTTQQRDKDKHDDDDGDHYTMEDNCTEDAVQHELENSNQSTADEENGGVSSSNGPALRSRVGAVGLGQLYNHKNNNNSNGSSGVNNYSSKNSRNHHHPRHSTTSSSSVHHRHRPSKRKKSSYNHKSWYQAALQSFTLTFIAEWGDRSQFATIALSAHQNPWGVTVGGCVGHTVCTGLAVAGGRLLAARISEKTVHQWGGAIFLVFGIHSLCFET